MPKKRVIYILFNKKNQLISYFRKKKIALNALLSSLVLENETFGSPILKIRFFVLLFDFFIPHLIFFLFVSFYDVLYLFMS